MKPLSRYFAILATALIITCGGVSGNQSRHYFFTDSTHYYWYFSDDDSYDSYNTIADEIAHLEAVTGVYVDTSPYGSSLVARGYSNNAHPHNIWPSSLLYAHY